MTSNNINTPLTHRSFKKFNIPQRQSDGYLSATAMCSMTQRKFSTYFRSSKTKKYLTALSTDVQICTSDLIQTLKGGNEEQGTWIHPKAAIHFAQWLSPEFAVQVTNWVYDWMTIGNTPSFQQKIHIPTSLIPLKYHGSTLLLVQHNNALWVDFESVVSAATLDYRYQSKRATLETLDLGKVEGKLSIISMDNLALWLEGINIKCVSLKKQYVVTRTKYELHSFLTAKIAELPQLIESEPEQVEMKHLGHYSIDTVMKEVAEFHPDWIVINRKALSEDVEYVADILMETQAKIRQQVDPLITILGTQDTDNEKEAEEFWKRRKAKALKKLQRAIA